jgi:hypothetical protein
MTSAPIRLSNRANSLRRVRNSELNASGKVRKSAFMPRREGQDRDGLSVSIETAELSVVHRAMFEGDGHRAPQILVGSVRDLPPLDVVARPTAEDPAHALITGMPDRTLGIEQLATVEHLARELAKRATAYTFPDAGENRPAHSAM